MKLDLPLAEAEGSCAKPNCKYRAAPQRHHRAHEALWFGAWSHRGSEPKWLLFVQRYHEFREEDIVRLCPSHHAEIHAVYDEVIAKDKEYTELSLYLYSWTQGEILMDKLRDACDEWLLEDTPGIDGDSYENTKRIRRGLLKKSAAKRTPQNKGKVAAKRRKTIRKKRKPRTPKGT